MNDRFRTFDQTNHQTSRLALFAAIALACTAGLASAQQSASHAAADEAAQVAPSDSAILTFFQNTEVSGFVDGYYSYNFNKPASRRAGNERNFDVQHNSFSLNMAELALEKKPTANSRGGFRLDLDYGQAQTIVNASEPGDRTVLQNLGQAYVSYLIAPGSGLQIDFGKFVTPAGFEVIKTKDDWNYSRSLLFANAIPYYHMGLRAAFNVGSKLALTGYLVNGWNNVLDNNTAKTMAAQATVKPFGSLVIVENYIGGPEQPNGNQTWRHLSDTVVTYTVIPHLSLGGNYDYGRDKQTGAKVTWQGFAGYARFQPSGWFAVSPRAEIFSDPEGFITGMAQTIKEFTLTGELKSKDGVIFRLEYRHDFSDIIFFAKNASRPSKQQNTFTGGLVYYFSSKTP